MFTLCLPLKKKNFERNWFTELNYCLVVPTGQSSNFLIKDLIEILIFSMKRTSSKCYSRKRNSAAPYILREKFLINECKMNWNTEV